MSERVPVRYAVLRDFASWKDATLSGLEAERDGTLTLARVPGTADGRAIIYPAPYDAARSGLAIGPDGDIYLADTAHHSIVRIMGGCPNNRFNLAAGAPGRLGSPHGMVAGRSNLYVADSATGGILVFRLPTLELRHIWKGPLAEPVGLASDSSGRIYVLDRGLQRILRFDREGVIDASFNAAMAQHAGLTAPAALAVVGRDILYVADQPTNAVLTFGADGGFLGTLPSAGAPARPRALVARGERLFAADSQDGWIHVHQTGQGWVGRLPDYRGPVSALAVDSAGRLFIKAGLDDRYDVLEAEAGYLAAGVLTAGPFDAGEESDWERVHVDAILPEETSAELRLWLGQPAPTEQDWASEKTAAAALDTLVPPLPGHGDSVPGQKRYLWVRVRLTSSDPRQSPRLSQVEAATTDQSYLDFLPAVYRRKDISTRLLERWLALFRGQLGDWHLALDAVARRFDPATAPEDTLPWLSGSLAFRLPENKDPGAWRRLLQSAYHLYQRRGTLFGIREFCEIYIGVRPEILEAFRERQIWRVEDSSSRLGFNTRLAPAGADGMIVAGHIRADPAYAGLRGEYYSGTNFERLRLTRIDPKVEFDWKLEAPPGMVEREYFSVRWTGQVQPRYSELYTFRTISDDGVRLWVDGRLLIDDWHEHGPTENSGQIGLTAGKWYTITLEYFELVWTAGVSLFWSSRSQLHEIIPQERLYALVDEGARLKDSGDGAGTETMLVGSAVVGEDGPLPAADFGAPLFSGTAHLFTALVPGARLPSVRQRRVLREVIEAEKPAHTDFHLCFVEARMRVGFQARVGVDSIVAGPPPPMSMNGTVLGWDSYLGDNDDDAGEVTGRLSKHARVGQDAVVR